MISKPELGMIPPGSDDQTTSITIVSSPSSDNVATVNQPPVKELDLGKVPNSPASASKTESQPTVNNAKQPDKPQAIPSEHQQPPNYQHPPAVCRVRGDGNAGKLPFLFYFVSEKLFPIAFCLCSKATTCCPYP